MCFEAKFSKISIIFSYAYNCIFTVIVLCCVTGFSFVYILVAFLFFIPGYRCLKHEQYMVCMHSNTTPFAYISHEQTVMIGTIYKFNIITLSLSFLGSVFGVKLNHPVAGVNYPVAGVAHPVAVVAHPVAGVNYPVAGVAHPVAGVNYPVAGVVHPVAGVTQTVTGSWTLLPGSCTLILGSLTLCLEWIVLCLAI